MRAIEEIKIKKSAKMKFAAHMKHIYSSSNMRSRDVINQRMCVNKIHQIAAKQNCFRNFTTPDYQDYVLITMSNWFEPQETGKKYLALT